VDEDGTKKHPLMLHASISGSIDRNLYALLEAAHMRQLKGIKPMLPLWLSPTQVRIMPISDEFLADCVALADRFTKECVRADVDDRSLSIGKKIREAEMEWVPRIIVVGEKEKSSGRFSVRVRESGEQKEMSLDDAVGEVKGNLVGFPYRPLPLPRMLSKRPRFV
jgi:threonyl-tRNA synthetase